MGDERGLKVILYPVPHELVACDEAQGALGKPQELDR